LESGEVEQILNLIQDDTLGAFVILDHHLVIPNRAYCHPRPRSGIQFWIPAFAGMTEG